MRIKQLLTKTLLVVALLGVGSMSAWADDEIITLYPTGTVDPTNLAQWSYHNNLTTSQDEDKTYVGFTNQGSANNYRSFHLKFYNTGSDFYEDYDSYTVTFDFWNNDCWSNSYSSTAEIVMYSEGATIPSPLYSLFSGQNTSKKNYLLYMTGSGTWINTFAVNGSDKSVTFAKNTWYTVKIIVSTTGTVNYTISQRGSETALTNGSGTYNATADDSNYKCQGLFFSLGRGGYETRINNVKVYVKKDDVTDPVINAPTYEGDNRSVEITSGVSSEDYTVKTYYTTNGEDPTTASTLYTGAITITSDCTVKALSVSSAGVSSGIVSLPVTVGKLTLKAPTLTRKGYSNGEYTVNINHDQSELDFIPEGAVVKYRIGTTGSYSNYSTAVSVPEGETIYAYVECDKYNASSEALLATGIRAYLESDASWTLDFKGQATTDKGAVTIGSEASFKVGSTNYYPITASSFTSNDNFAVKDDNNLLLRNTGSKGLYSQASGGRALGIGNLTAGQHVVVNCSGYASYYESVAGVGEYLPLCSTPDQLVFRATSAGNMSITMSRYYYIQSIVVYNSDPVKLAIANCKANETSSAFATYISEKKDNGDLLTSGDVYAAHTEWQIENAASNDITKVIFNAAVADASYWEGASTLSGQKYTGAPDDNYLDRNGAEFEATQIIYGLPVGRYLIKVATRASASTYSEVYAKNGAYNINNVQGIHAGSTDGELGNGWAWTYVPFEITKTTNVKLGFYAATVGGWASCDDWHLYKVTDNYSVEISSAGWATLCAPYSLNFAGTGLTAYIAKLDTENSTVTLEEVTNVPAQTGVVLKGNADTYSIPLKDNADHPQGNDLKGSVSWATGYDANYSRYYLALNDGKAQFTKLNEGGSIAAGKAYLEIAKSNTSRTFSVVFANETTGVSASLMNSEKTIMNGEVYNLQGQRVFNPGKGLYVVNGKKIINN